MIFDPFPMFLPSEYRVKFATDAWEQREAAALRRQVFCVEQGIFADDDRDSIDEMAIPIVAISSFGVVSQEVVGTVRIHQAEPLIAADKPVIWRKVGRNDPRKLVRGMAAARSAVLPGTSMPGVGLLFPAGTVDYECRPYELGWLLYAWLSGSAARREGSRPNEGAA